MRRRSPTALLLLLVLVAGAAFLVWRFLGERDSVGLGRARRAPAADSGAASDGRPTAGERDLAARSADASAPPAAASDVAIEPTPEHGVPVVVVAHGSGEPQPFALVTRIESPWDEPADPSSHRDVNWLLDHLGRRFRADERGFVRIPPSAGDLELFARAGPLAGYAPLHPGEVKARDDAPPKRIEVAPLADLRVRVVDPEGRPVAGVPLQIVGDGGGRTLPYILGECESTAPDGLAEVRGASLLVDEDVPPAQLLVCVQLPLRRPVSLRVARAELDGKPRTLVVPATGSVELVLVDERGSVPAIDRPASVVLLRAPRRGMMRREERELEIGIDSDVTFRAGHAQIPFVEPGDWIEADLDFNEQGRGYVQAAGPTVAGTVVRIEVPIRPNRDVVAIRGRVVDPDGKPISGRELNCSYLLLGEHGSCGGGEQARTKEDGSFGMSARGPDGTPSTPAAWEALRLDFSIRRPDGGYDFQQRLELDSEFARHGGDLGTIVLVRSPLLASGVVVDETGEPVEHVRLNLVQKREADPHSGLPSHPAAFDTERGEFTASSAADGRFTIFGDPGDGSFGIKVEDERHLPTPPIPIEPGATGLRIVVARSAALLAHVLLDPGVPPDSVLARIHVPCEADASQDWLEFGNPDERGDIHFERLPPRPAELEIRAEYFGELQERIARFDAIALEPGERTVDPRLQAIDLRGRFLATHVVVVDEDGQPVRNATLLPNPDSRSQGISDSSVEGTDLENGVGVIVTTRTPPPIDVEAEGFRSQRAVLVAPETRITLRRGIPVVVELDPSVPTLPETCYFAVSLVRDDFAEYADMAEIPTLSADSPRSIRVESPGDYVVQIWLARYSDRRSLGGNELKSGRTRIRIEDSDAGTSVRVSVTAADVKATLADLGL